MKQFGPQTNFDNLTFQELDDFINEWIVKTKEFGEVFDNQSSEVTRWYFMVHSNNDKLCYINYQLNVCNFLYTLVEQILNVGNQYHRQLAKKVLELEKQTTHLYKKEIVKDPQRHSMYNGVLSINEILTNSGNDLDHLTLGILTNDEKQVQDPTELIARILMRQLYNLEIIEERISKMSNYLDNINCMALTLKCQLPASIVRYINKTNKQNSFM